MRKFYLVCLVLFLSSAFNHQLHAANIELNNKFFGAVANKNLQEAKYYLALGADINYHYKGDLHALHVAVFLNCKDIVLWLLEEEVDVNVLSLQGTTAMGYAISTKNLNMCKLLWQNGASLSHVNNLGVSNMQLAQEVGCKSIINFLNNPNAKITPYLYYDFSMKMIDAQTNFQLDSIIYYGKKLARIVPNEIVENSGFYTLPWHNIGMTYLQKGDYKNADKYLKKSYDYASKFNEGENDICF